MPILPRTEKQEYVRYALAFASVIVLWVVLHDIHLIHVEPRHFTEYHRKLLPLTNLTLTALQYAWVASFGPGLLFGFMACFAARGGAAPRKNLAPVLAGFTLLLLMIEAVLLGIGAWANHRYQLGLPPLYPASFYPDHSQGIVYTQSVNISAYLIAPATGFLYLLFVFFLRQKPA